MVESKRWASCGHQAARPVTAQPAGRGRQEAEHDRQQRGLAGTGGPVTASQRPGSATADSPLKTGGPPGHAAARSVEFHPGPAAAARRASSTGPTGRGSAAAGTARTPESLIRRSTDAQRRVLAYRRRHGRIRFHQRQLEQYHDGDGRRALPHREDQRARRGQRWPGRRRRTASDGDSLAEPVGDGGALRGRRRGPVLAPDGGQNRGRDTVGVQFGAGVQGRRDAAQDAGAQLLFGAGGHPVAPAGPVPALLPG